MTRKEALTIIGGLSEPSKMPCYAFSLPPEACPTGAKLQSIPGTPCFNCYAMKGNHRRKNVKNALSRNLERLREALDDPAYRERYIDAFIWLLRNQKHFRWFEAGDLQSELHLHIINQICWHTPLCEHWMSTLEYNTVLSFVFNSDRTFAPNLTIRVSSPLVDSTPRVSEQVTRSVVITNPKAVPPSVICPASLITKWQDRKCNDCRMCWNNEQKLVAYLKH